MICPPQQRRSDLDLPLGRLRPHDPSRHEGRPSLFSHPVPFSVIWESGSWTVNIAGLCCGSGLRTWLDVEDFVFEMTAEN